MKKILDYNLTSEQCAWIWNLLKGYQKHLFLNMLILPHLPLSHSC